MRISSSLVVALQAVALPAFAQSEPVVEVVPEPAPPPAEAAPPPTAAPPGAWSLGIAASLGVAVPSSELGPMAIGGLEVDFALPALERRLVVALDASITRPSLSGSGSDPRAGGGYDYDLAVTELKLGLDLVFRFFPPDRALVPYLGAGPIVHLVESSESTTLAPGDNTEHDTSLGFQLVGGLDYRLGPGMLLAEVRYLRSGLDHRWTGESNAGNLVVAAGYRFVF